MENTGYEWIVKQRKLLQKAAQKESGLRKLLAQLAVSQSVEEQNWLTAFAKEIGKPLSNVSKEDFLSDKMKSAVRYLGGEELAEKLPILVDICMEGQYSDSPYRRSFRSHNAFYYVPKILLVIAQVIREQCQTKSVNQRLCEEELYYSGLRYWLACEVRQENPLAIQLLHDAMWGDNSKGMLSQSAIGAIILSGNEELLEDLLKLLKAAKLQEGLRQSILESADEGSPAVLIRILQFCLEENLFRFSSGIRALDTWTGLTFGDAKDIRKYAQYAYDCLTSETVRRAYLDSPDHLKAFFALWGYGNYEVEDTNALVEKLLDDPMHDRRVLGWYFISQADNVTYQMRHAANHLEERDGELLAWIVQNLAYSRELVYNASYGAAPKVVAYVNAALPKKREERQALFAKLKETALFIGNQKKTFTGNPFPFSKVELSSEPVYKCMLSVAGYDMDENMVEELLTLSDRMPSEQRLSLIAHFIQPKYKASHRIFLREALKDRSVFVKERAVEELEKCALEQIDMDSLAEALKSKSSSLRGAILRVMQAQKPELVRDTISQMLDSTQSYQNQAAIEMLIGCQDKNPEILAENREQLQALRQRSLPTQTMILLEQLHGNEKDTVTYSAENGYGLYDPGEMEQVAARLRENRVSLEKQTWLGKLRNKEQSPLLSEKELRARIPSWEEVDGILERMDQVFVRHADYEYKVSKYGDSTQTHLFGNIGEPWERSNLPLPADCEFYDLRSPEARLEMLPFYREFLQALGDYATDIPKMLGLYLVLLGGNQPWMRHNMQKYPWIHLVETKGLAPNYSKKAEAKYKRGLKFGVIIEKLPFTLDSHAVFEEALLWYASMISVLGEENLKKDYMEPDEGYMVYNIQRQIHYTAMDHPMVRAWRYLICRLPLQDADFTKWFSLEYPLEQALVHTCQDWLGVEAYFRAVDMGIVPKTALYALLLNKKYGFPETIMQLTKPIGHAEGKRIFERYPWAKEAVNLVLDRIVSVEEKRGEMPTTLTQHCNAIERFEGAQHFCNLLAALGKENFYRGYDFSYDTSKQAVLSRLLKRCYPAPTDTPETLAACLAKTDITEKRLAEAVMYAPQWAGMVERVIHWPGLKSGVWLFHAHINELFSAEKETETAIYSPISPLQFNDGAFDKHWFLEAYEQLGEKRFRILYQSAKYITSGSTQHRRSQLYADAVLGKLNITELEAEITDKRNQEKLRCYPLIPMAEDDLQEALRRYEFIQKFQKESKQFGAQRRDSEKKACATALENLAITTGIMDVNRLMWRLESAKLEEIRPLMEFVELDGVQVCLQIDENGDAGLHIVKNGKPLKTLPKTLNKHETVLSLKETIKELKEQKRRAKESLERAMTECTEFGVPELSNILSNPVLAPMLKHLVWNREGRNGFLSMESGAIQFATLDGSEALDAEAKLRIAHPHDLRQAGEWATYMHLLYEQKLVQPFKQVFREYYPITADELAERTISRRYAGFQVNPKRTVALLKGRGWTVDYEEGLQKVYYKENLVLHLYALADWFSPGDIEAPTLETMEFLDRKTWKPVPLETVPPILFSEAMRDLDLVVSVAHVGGVDPEASHSTVEMRVAIAKELTELLKLSNVTWIGSHAKIHGSLASYSVHMGSGVVHAEGIGMVAILPVHSQARGRVFLPFADDDPKTAEILSKIILLSEDQKIKDPYILRQIRQ